PAPQRRRVTAPVGAQGRRQQPLSVAGGARPAPAERRGARADRPGVAGLHAGDVPARRSAGRSRGAERDRGHRRGRGPDRRAEADPDPDLRDLPTGERPGGRHQSTGGDMSKRDLPAAVYAAAGAGDLALRRLRRLNRSAGRTVRAAAGAATDLRGRATDLRERMTDLRERASDLRGRASGLRERATALRSYRIDRARVDAELARLRESARRGGT